MPCLGFNCYNASGKFIKVKRSRNSIMSDKVLIITILSLLGVGFIAVLFIAIPWFTNYLLPNWKDTLVDSGIVMVAIVLFVYGFYMNTRMH
jgi:ABC-type Na+ efflux pump permease subunit